jgi:DNA-binding HxlR family transcriptional regulator
MGDYWTPLIVRELLSGTDHFNQLVRNLPNISRTLLANRLQTLERLGVVKCHRDSRKNTSSYCLTEAGRDLQKMIDAMSDWGLRWGTPDPDPADLDPLLVICLVNNRVRRSQLPDERIVIEVVAAGYREARAWLVCERQDVSMCYDHPGFDIDLWVKSKASTLYQICQQRSLMAAALKCGNVEVDGPPALISRFVSWFDSSENRS